MSSPEIDEVSFINNLIDKGLVFLTDTFSKNKEITRNFLVAFISEPEIFNSNYVKIMNDIEAEFEFFIELIGDNLELWNKYLIPNMTNGVLFKICQNKLNKPLELIVNHPQWIGDTPIDCFISRNINCVEKFLTNKVTREKTFEWINFIRTCLPNHSKIEITTQNCKKLAEESTLYCKLFKQFNVFLNKGIKNSGDYEKIKSDSKFTDTNFMTILFSTLIQFVEKKFLMISEEIYVRKHFIKIINEKIPIIDSMIEEVRSFNSNANQIDILNVEKIKLKMQIEFENTRISQLEEEKVDLRPEVDKFLTFLEGWIHFIIDNPEFVSNADEALNCYSAQYNIDKIKQEDVKYFEAVLGNDLTKNPSIKINVIYNLYELLGEFPRLEIVKFSENILEKISLCFIDTEPKLTEYTSLVEIHIKMKFITVLLQLGENYNFPKNSLTNQKIFSIIFSCVNKTFQQKKILEKNEKNNKDINKVLFLSVQLCLLYIENVISDKDLKEDLLSGSIINVFTEMFVNSLNCIIENDPIKYPNFTHSLSGFFIKIIEAFLIEKKFIKSIVSQELHPISDLLLKFMDLLSELRQGFFQYSTISVFIIKCDEEKKKLKVIEEVPDEFCDPLMCTLIENPVELPEGKIIMDKDIISRHLLSSQFDPFNRSILTLKMLEEHNDKPEVKDKLECFIRKRDEWKKSLE